jgi:hypothetical protein
VCEDVIEAESAVPGHEAGVVADATAILVTGDIANMVVAVFDAPNGHE